MCLRKSIKKSRTILSGTRFNSVNLIACNSIDCLIVPNDFNFESKICLTYASWVVSSAWFHKNDNHKNNCQELHCTWKPCRLSKKMAKRHWSSKHFNWTYMGKNSHCFCDWKHLFKFGYKKMGVIDVFHYLFKLANKIE